MATIINLVSCEYVKQICAINEEIDDKLLQPFIYAAQQLQIEPILGTKLYQALQGSPAGNYLTLLNDYVQPALAQWSYVEALPSIWARIGNGGIFKNAPTNTESTSLNEISFMQDQAKRRAENYSERLTNYIQCNSSLFPELTENEDDDIRPNDYAPFYGVSLDKPEMPNYRRKLFRNGI